MLSSGAIVKPYLADGDLLLDLFDLLPDSAEVSQVLFDIGEPLVELSDAILA